MADPAVLTGLPWPLPAHSGIAEALATRWREPHRRYHDPRHLAECLAAAGQLDAGPLELLALWFHDAVHTNTPGSDETASAELAVRLLDMLPAHEAAEVGRLVELTRRHRPAPGDRAGAIVCDADLWVLGADPVRYAESVADLRAELGLDPSDWTTWRRRQLRSRLDRPIYHTVEGRRREAAARLNLTRELGELAA